MYPSNEQSTLGSTFRLHFPLPSPPSRPIFCRHVSSPRFLHRKRGTFASGCGTPAINLSRHAIIFAPSARIYRERPPTPTRRYIPTRARVRTTHIRVHARTGRTDDETNARDSRARDNDTPARAPRVYSPSKARQHARAPWRVHLVHATCWPRALCTCMCARCVCAHE